MAATVLAGGSLGFGMPNPLTTKTLRAMFWAGAGTGGQAVLQLLILAILARLLSPADFGLVAVGMVAISFTEIFSQIGVGPALVQKKDLSSTDLATAQTIAICSSCVLFLAIWASSGLIQSLFSAPGAAAIVQCLGVVFIIQGLSVCAEATLQRELAFKKLAVINLASQALGYGLVSVIAAQHGFGYWSLVWGQITKSALKTVFLLVSVRTFKLGFNYASALSMMNFGVGFTLAKVCNFVALQCDNFVVGRYLGVGPLGIYTRAYHFIEMAAVFVGHALDQVLFPAMASIQTEIPRLERAYRRAVDAVMLLLLPLSAIALAGAQEIVWLLLGPQWGEVVLPLQVLLVALAFRAGYRVSDSLSRAMGAVYRRAWRQFFYAIAALVGAYIGRRWGIAGVAAGVSLAILLNYIVMLQLACVLLSTTMASFFRSHLIYVFMSVLVYISADFAAVGARELGAPQILTLAVTCATGMVVSLALLTVASRTRAGENIVAIFELLRSQIRRRKPKQ